MVIPQVPRLLQMVGKRVFPVRCLLTVLSVDWFEIFTLFLLEVRKNPLLAGG